MIFVFLQNLQKKKFMILKYTKALCRILLAIVINKNPKIESTHKGWFEELNNEKLCNFE